MVAQEYYVKIGAGVCIKLHALPWRWLSEKVTDLVPKSAWIKALPIANNTRSVDDSRETCSTTTRVLPGAVLKSNL